MQIVCLKSEGYSETTLIIWKSCSILPASFFTATLSVYYKTFAHKDLEEYQK